MEEPKKDPQNGDPGAGGGEEPTPKVDPEDIQKLQDQVTNLNKGLATYRDEIGNLKTENVQLKTTLEDFKKMVDEETEEEEAPLDPKEQKKLEAWAKKHGYVTKEDLEAERTKSTKETVKAVEAQAVSEFIENHPEYDNEEKWAEVQKIFRMYRTPNDLKGFRDVLKRVHGELSGEEKVEDSKAAVKAELHRKGRLSLGGGSQKKTSTDTTIEDLQEKYPNLSRAQIESRLEELKELYPEGKKK